MAIIRQENWLSQQRVDLPHLRSIELGVAGDFDSLVGRAMAGSKALVVRGFAMANIAANAPATGLQISTANGVLYNVNATEAGSILWVPADRSAEILNPATNSRVSGSWTPSAANYVGVDFVRTADTSTTDLVQFLDANTLLETPKSVPLARTLDYRFVISTIPFAGQPNLVPIAIVTLNSSSQITAAEDARPMMFRLATGGDVPNIKNAYPFPDGRTENFSTLNNTLFVGGDKSIDSQKSWMDAAMTRIQEIGGGEYWYSATADRNVQMVTYGSTFTNGEYFSWNLGTQTLSWQNIRFLFDNSTGWFNDLASGSITMNDGDALYVDLDRTQNATGLTAQHAPLVSMGTSTPPGSRWVMAWRKGNDIFTRGWRYAVGTTFQPATNTSLGEVELNQPADATLITTPKVAAITTGGGIIVAAFSGNTAGGVFTGFGTGSGLTATGGAGGGPGVNGVGTGSSPGGVFTAAGAVGLTATGASGLSGALLTGGNNGAGAGGFGLIAFAGTGTGGLGGWGVAGRGASGTTFNGPGVVGYFGGSPTIGADESGAGVLGYSTTTANALVGSADTTTGAFALLVKDVAGATSRNIAFIGGNLTLNAVGATNAITTLAGGINLVNTAKYTFSTVKTGQIIIPATEFVKFSGTGSLQAAGASMAGMINWALGGAALRLFGRARLPRGATITAVEGYYYCIGNAWKPDNPAVTLILDNGAGVVTRQTILASGVGPVTIPINTEGWITLGAVAAHPAAGGRTGVGNSSFIELDYNMTTLSGGGGEQFGALRLTYTYTEVDFLV